MARTRLRVGDPWSDVIGSDQPESGAPPPRLTSSSQNNTPTLMKGVTGTVW